MISLFLMEVRLAIRSGGGFSLALAFFGIIILFVALGVGAERDLLTGISIAMVWIAALLACLLSLERLFALDQEDGSLEQYALAPIPLEGVVLAKTLAHWLTTGLPLSILSIPLGLTLNLPEAAYFALAGGLIIGTPALSMIGAFGAALSVGIKRGGVLLSLLVLPLYIPTLILGTEAARRTAEGLSPAQLLSLLGALTALSIAALPFATAAALRVNLR